MLFCSVHRFQEIRVSQRIIKFLIQQSFLKMTHYFLMRLILLLVCCSSVSLAASKKKEKEQVQAMQSTLKHLQTENISFNENISIIWQQLNTLQERQNKQSNEGSPEKKSFETQQQELEKQKKELLLRISKLSPLPRLFICAEAL